MAGTGPLNPGTSLAGRYLVERMLGGGGMGVVYLARDQRLANRACAIKEMVDHFIDPQQRLEANEYFAREADTLAQLKHQAIPAITDRFDAQNRHYLVMEYVEGRNLEEEIAVRGGPLPEGLIIDVARQLCDVLAYLHGSTPPVVYRDMKPLRWKIAFGVALIGCFLLPPSVVRIPRSEIDPYFWWCCPWVLLHCYLRICPPQPRRGLSPDGLAGTIK